jgi:PAS domain S-box-containing protein
MAATLDRIVTSVATQLMRATAHTAKEVSELVLAQLVEQFDVDAGFLRHNDNDMRASKLVAEWPSRYEHRDPDPLAVVYFADADQFFVRSEHARKPAVVRPDPTTYGYVCPVAADGQEVLPSVAVAPLVWGGAVTTGVLGLVKYGVRAWTPEEINLLEAIAALFAQLQARIAAEDKPRYLAEHDDLTDLHNRRARMAHICDSFAPRRPTRLLDGDSHDHPCEGPGMERNRRMERRRNGRSGDSPMDILMGLPAVVVLERIPVPTLAVTRDGAILFANTAFAEMVGYRQDRLVGLAFPQIFHTVPAAVGTLSDVHALANLVVELHHSEGWTVRAKMSKSALKRGDDPVVLVTFENLTERLWVDGR